ncbi:response regulator [Cohnella soli]|uniref:Response regulator n=1 Tax=Cohnella soli TaxID=425005 RepID=A0ABW0HUT3_9BACL
MNRLEMKKHPIILIVSHKMDWDIADETNIGFKIEVTEGGRIPDLLSRLDFVNPDCLVIDLDASTAELKEDLDAWTELREICEMRYIPLIGVAEKSNPELEWAVLADAFLHPADHTGLQRHVRKLLERRERILGQILIDPLTGAFNDKYLRREVDLQLSDIKRSYETFALVYAEIDQSESDPGLRRVATRSLADFIQKSIRPTDRLAHHPEGGFVLVLPKTVKDDAAKLMKRLIQLFSEMPIDTNDGPKHVSFSAKVKEFTDPGISVDECLALMPFTEADPQERQGLVLDSSDDGKMAVRKLMVAIIDDDRLIRELLKQQLADIGEELYHVEVRAFEDGEAFFNDPWHRQNERFLVIIDRIMPKMDGLEVLSRIRAGYDRRRYLCVMVSSRGAETEIALAIQKGANDYVVKPFSLKELRVRIQRLIGGMR